MKLKRIIFTVLFVLVGLGTNELMAWGPTGHRVIAEIAQRNLTKKASKEIKKIIGDYPMAYWSSWADNIKSDTTGRWNHTYIWHYLNIPGNMEKDEMIKFANSVEQDNVYNVIPRLCAALQSDTLTAEGKQTTLYFLVHLVGDLHQPMHVGRYDDLGGNKITVYWFGKKTNIHAVWDDDIISYEKYGYTEYTDILNCLSKKEKKNVQSGELVDWLYETYEIANEVYSSIENEAKLSYSYPYKYKATMETQLQHAGYRLAQILNTVFK